MIIHIPLKTFLMIRFEDIFYDTDSFIVYLKSQDIYKDIGEDVETTFDTSVYELKSNSIERQLPKGKNKKVFGLMKDELGRNIMTKFIGLRAKTYSYIIDDGSENKKQKGTKNCVATRKVKFENYKNCLETTQLKNKINYLEKNKIEIDCNKENHKEFIKAINQY